LQDAYVSIKTKYPSLDVMMFSPEFFVRVHQIYDRMLVNLEKHEFGCFTGEKPMSGFYAVLYALSTCKQVRLSLMNSPARSPCPASMPCSTPSPPASRSVSH
jgi:hypothetical protein